MSAGPGGLPWLAGAYAAGIGFAAQVAPLAPTVGIAGLFPLVLLALALSRWGLRRAALALLAGAFALAGAVRDGLDPRPGPAAAPCAATLGALGLPPPDETSPAHLRIEGRVEGSPRFGPRSTVARLRVERAGPPRPRPDAPLPPAVEAGFGLELVLPPDLRPFAGDRLLAEVELDDAPLEGPEGPARRERLAREGLACTGRVREGRAVVVEPANGPATAVERKRRELLAAMRARMEPGPAAGLVAALGLGDREGIDTDQAQRFSDSGLAHILSVSGLHLALTVLGAFRLLAALLRRTPLAARVDPQRLAAVVTLPLAPAYALFTGATPPVVRAAIAAGLYLLALATGRAPDGWSALGLALLALLAFAPTALFDPSVQLSFVACWGLLVLHPPLRAAVPFEKPGPDAPWWRKAIEAILGALLTTAAATLATLPFTALHFERVSLASLPANVVAVPVSLVATVLCAVTAAAGLVHEALLDLPLALAQPVAGWLDRLAAHFATWPGARIPLPGGDPLLRASLVAIPLAVWLAGRHRRAGLALLLVAVGALVAARWPAAPDGRLHVEFLPVGQGDCTLVTLPDGSAILVDAGGDPAGMRDVGALRVLPQLQRRGVHRLAAVAISHLHPDHVGGIPSVLRALEVEELWTSSLPLEGPWGSPVAAAARERAIPRRVLRAGDRLQRAGVTIEVLGPPDPPEGLEENDASLVLRIVHGDVAVLLPGDVEEVGEWALVDSGSPIQAQLLKAPHHGSRTSSTAEFIQQVRPHHVVFCVGHRNRFGFPHGDVVERYRTNRCELHRTDRGPVHFVSDGSQLRRSGP